MLSVLDEKYLLEICNHVYPEPTDNNLNYLYFLISWNAAIVLHIGISDVYDACYILHNGAAQVNTKKTWLNSERLQWLYASC